MTDMTVPGVIGLAVDWDKGDGQVPSGMNKYEELVGYN